jgi:hypothetical protein
VIDIQDRLAAVMKYRESVVTNTLHLIELARLAGMPVVLTEQYPKGLGATVEEIRRPLADRRRRRAWLGLFREHMHEIAVVLLDSEANGVALSGLYGRQDSRVYAKAIYKGQGERPLKLHRVSLVWSLS